MDEHWGTDNRSSDDTLTYNILTYDTIADDFFTTLVMYPFSVAQVAAMGGTDATGKGDAAYGMA